MAELSFDRVFDAALRIQICDRKMLTLDFQPGKISLQLPSRELLARHCSVPARDIRRIFLEMEDLQLVATDGQGLVWTTPRGNLMIADILEHRYSRQVRDLFGPRFQKYVLSQIRHAPGKRGAEPRSGPHEVRHELQLASGFFSPLERAVNIRTCKCCGMKFPTNDNRRKYCDRCKKFREIPLVKTLPGESGRTAGLPATELYGN
ncbi:MAG: hypothetical protein ABFC24_12895 [Methanoregulaceae archaeon]